jgi:hypothetical protein
MATRKKAQARPVAPDIAATEAGLVPAAAEAVQTLKHRARRKNIPPAGLDAQGRVEDAPRVRHHFNPHLSPQLRVADDPGAADRLPALLQTARERALSDEEARLLARSRPLPRRCGSNATTWAGVSA